MQFVGGDVSIHAPVKSATFKRFSSLCKTRRFNPRARKERDITRSIFSGAIPCFNPRARKERDDGVAIIPVPSLSFNPRARKERDLL